LLEGVGRSWFSVRFLRRARLGSVLAAAALTVALAACGSDSPDTPTATTAAETATTVAAATTTAGATTTVADDAPVDAALARIATMESCDTLATTKRISQADLDGNPSPIYQKLYGDRMAAVDERMAELGCPAS
jgi:hypothetical protein